MERLRAMLGGGAGLAAQPGVVCALRPNNLHGVCRANPYCGRGSALYGHGS